MNTTTTADGSDTSHDNQPPGSSPGVPEREASSGSVVSLGTARVLVAGLVVIAFAAFVAIWSGWVGLGTMAGFGPVQLLPGISEFTINAAITLPLGMEAYAALALHVWISGKTSTRTTTYARRSAISSLLIGASGQIAYHLLTASHVTTAPWPVTLFVSVLPVAVLGAASALIYFVLDDKRTPTGLPAEAGAATSREVGVPVGSPAEALRVVRCGTAREALRVAFEVLGSDSVPGALRWIEAQGRGKRIDESNAFKYAKAIRAERVPRLSVVRAGADADVRCGVVSR